jgi:AcrR family transcriptional regulator
MAHSTALFAHVQPVPRSRVHRRSGVRQMAILKAALACFAEYGYARTTLANIQQRAKASIGSIYHHFGSKEQIAGALYVEGLRDYHHSLLEALRKSSDARSAIRSVVLSKIGWVTANPDWARYLFDNWRADFVVATEREIQRLNKEMFHEMQAALEVYQARGEIARVPIDLVVALLIGPAQYFAEMWLGGRAATDIAVASESLADAAWRSVAMVGKNATTKGRR